MAERTVTAGRRVGLTYVSGCVIEGTYQLFLTGRNSWARQQ